MSFYSDFAEMINTKLDITRVTETLGPMNRPTKTKTNVGTLDGYLEYLKGTSTKNTPLTNIQADARIYTGPEVLVKTGDILKDSSYIFEVVFVNDMLLNDHIEIDVVRKTEL